MPNQTVHEEWIALQRASVPGAMVLWRSAFTKMDDKPFFNCLDITNLSPEWYPKDRVKMYPGTFSCRMPRDPFPFVDPVPSPCHRASFARKVKTTTNMILHPLTTAGKKASSCAQHGDKMSAFYGSQAVGYDAVRERMLVARPEMMSGFGPIKNPGHTWLDIGGGTGRNLHYLRAQLDHFQRIVVADICPELLEMGEENARRTFTPDQCRKIRWVRLDINAPNARQVLSALLDKRGDGPCSCRGFDTISFSYSLSMIPQWQGAIQTAKSLLSDDGRIIIADFDTYTEAGNSVKDLLIRTWYRQDGVRIEVDSREYIRSSFDEGYVITMARFQRKLAGVRIPHYVACCRKLTVTTSEGTRRPSTVNLKALGRGFSEDSNSPGGSLFCEEKKTD
jgi:S-adenosylmethionine-diacylgycerolhomoserine-N-methlytransferase